MIHALVMGRVLHERHHADLAQEIVDHLNGGLLATHMRLQHALALAPVPNDPTSRVLVAAAADTPTHPPVLGIVPLRMPLATLRSS